MHFHTTGQLDRAGAMWHAVTLMRHSLESQNADLLLEEGVTNNFDPTEVQDNTPSVSPKPRYDSRTGGPPSAMASAALLRPRDASVFVATL